MYKNTFTENNSVSFNWEFIKAILLYQTMGYYTDSFLKKGVSFVTKIVIKMNQIQYLVKRTVYHNNVGFVWASRGSY